jgi:hypothetical protein
METGCLSFGMSFEVGDNSKKFLIAGDALNNHYVAFRHPELPQSGPLLGLVEGVCRKETVGVG